MQNYVTIAIFHGNMDKLKYSKGIGSVIMINNQNVDYIKTGHL